MGLTLVIDEIITEERTYKYNKTLRVVDPNKAEVTEAYFAIKQIKYIEKESGETFSYTFKNKTSVKAQKDKTKIADIIRGKLKFDGDKKYTKNKQIIASFTKDVYEAKESITIKALKKEKRTYYLKVNAGSMGNQMYLVVETKNLKGKKVKLKIHEDEKELKLLKDKDALLPVLVYAKKEDKTTDTEASDWIELNIETVKAKDAGTGFYISDDGKDKEVGIKKIQLRPKKDKMASKTEEASKSFEGWAEKLYIREDETEEGKKSKEAEEKEKKDRDAETFVTLTRSENADKKENKKSFPKKITWLKNIEIGKQAVYTISNYKAGATETDKNNIRWSLYVQGDDKPKDKKSLYITTKSKTGLYTYAKMEIINGKNQLTIILDKALKGKKVQIEPFRGAPELNTKKDYVSTTKIKEKATPKITKLDTTKLWLQTQCDECTKKEKEFLKGSYFKLKSLDTIYIYHDGKISKTPLTLLKKIRYVYIANDGEEHDLGKYNIVEAQKWNYGSKKYHQGWKKITLNKKIRYYEYAKGKVKLIKFKLPLTYNSKSINIKLNDNSKREYINPESYACLIGALAEVGYDDVTLNGFTSEDGTGAPSLTHFNGIAGDFRYLRKDKKIAVLHINTSPDELDVERQEKFIDALVKFGWKSFYSYNIKINKKDFRLKKSTHLADHHHHLHLRREKFKPNYK